MAAVSANNTIHLFAAPKYIRSPFPGVPEDLRCRYTSKPCGNLRTTKRGGGLHRFCDYHRARANENQWRVDHRRRLRKIETGTPLAPPRERSPRHQVRSPTAALPVLMPNDCAVGCTDSDMLLSPEELLILQALLFSDEDETPDAMPVKL